MLPTNLNLPGSSIRIHLNKNIEEGQFYFAFCEDQSLKVVCENGQVMTYELPIDEVKQKSQQLADGTLSFVEPNLRMKTHITDIFQN